MSREMGVPIARRADPFPERTGAPAGDDPVLDRFAFDALRGTTLVAKEPIGVCGLITPWNWPINQVVCKVAPALAAGCTMVLKPSEVSPLSALIIAEILHEAGVPTGVFNLVNGDGAHVGHAIAAHPDIDMVSFTGSTRAGVAVAKAAADTVKRVAQELGGKSANILLPDADFERAVTLGVEPLLQQQRPVLRRADAHAGAARRASPRRRRSRRRSRRRDARRDRRPTRRRRSGRSRTGRSSRRCSG